jgi:hypothetical protein
VREEVESGVSYFKTIVLSLHGRAEETGRIIVRLASGV